MHKFFHVFALLGALLLGSLSVLNAADGEPQKPALKTAIFVNNLGGQELAAKASVLQAALAAELNGRGYAVLSPEQIAESLTKSGKREEDLGRMLTDNSSARALARTLGADYLMVAHLLGFNKRQVQYEGQGIKTDAERYRLRVSYSLLESAQGSGVAGDTFSVESTERQNRDGSLKISDGGRLDDMIAEAAVMIANNAVAQAEAGRIPAPGASGNVNFTVTARLQGVAVPEVSIDDKGRAQITPSVFPVDAVGATVEVDGVAVGSTPGTFQATPGLHQVRVTRPGFETWTRNVNLYDGFNLVVNMDFTPEGLAHWKNISSFLEKLKKDAQLTDAEAEAIRGQAQMLRQSGYKVDYKVDAKEAPATIVTSGGSIWEPVIVAGGKVIPQGPGPVIPEREPATADAPTIRLDANGSILWNGEKISDSALDSKLAELAATTNPRLLVTADPNIPLSKVTPILDKARAQKIRVQFKEQ